MTYCVGCRSSDIWGYVRLCVFLELGVYDGGMIGYIVAHMVITVWFYQYVLEGHGVIERVIFMLII